MKNLKIKLVSILLIIAFALTIMSTVTKAATAIEGIIFEKANGEKIIYIKGMEKTEFKYAFSNESNDSNANFVTSLKDTNGENTALLEAGNKYDYMYVMQESKTETVELNKLPVITEKESKEVEALTNIINIKTSTTNRPMSKSESGATITTITGKIEIQDDGSYQYQSIEIVDKNDSIKEENKAAKELYEALTKLSSAKTMYDKLQAEITIRDDYKKLLEEAKWEEAKNKEILQEANSQEGEKFLVLIQEVKDEKTVRTDIKVMTSQREDKKGVEPHEDVQKKVVEKKVALPVTGENLALYIALGFVVLAIIILAVKMNSKKGKHDAK